MSNAYYIWLLLNSTANTVESLIRKSTNFLKNLSKKYANKQNKKKYDDFIKSSFFFKLKSSELKLKCETLGINRSYCINKQIMILFLEGKTKMYVGEKEPDLDEDQLKVLRSKESKILIHAGPGAGKLQHYVH